MDTGQDDKRKVPQPPTRRGDWKGTGGRIIGEVAGHEIHLEIEGAWKKKKKRDNYNDWTINIYL